MQKGTLTVALGFILVLGSPSHAGRGRKYVFMSANGGISGVVHSSTKKQIKGRFHKDRNLTEYKLKIDEPVLIEIAPWNLYYNAHDAAENTVFYVPKKTDHNQSVDQVVKKLRRGKSD